MITSAGASLPLAPPRLTVFDTGAEQCPQGQLPGQLEMTPEQAKAGFNPLLFLPGVGMIYRAITGTSVPAPIDIASSVISSAMFGGPLGIVGSLVLNGAMELARLGPDTSRPAVPEGMDVTGSEAGVRSITPGDPQQAGSYTTLATVLPDFLGGGTSAYADNSAQPQRVIAAYTAGAATGAG